MLKEAHNFKQVGRARVARRAEHAHQACGWNVRGLGETGESDSFVDVVAQNCLREGNLAGEHGFETCAEKFFAKLGVALHAVPTRFLKVAGPGHGRISHFPRSSSAP